MPANLQQNDHEQTTLDIRVVPWTLLALTVAAAALRLPFVGHQSLWFDEIYTRTILGSRSLVGLWNHVQSTESTPPLFYVVDWLLGSRSAAGMRLLPALAVVLSVPASYLAFVRLIGRRAALAAASVVAVSPILTSYACDARSYGLFVLSALLSVWGFSWVISTQAMRAYGLWTVAAAACVWTHYFGVFLVAGEAVLLFVACPDRRRMTIAWGLVLAGCVAPLLPLALHQSGDDRAAFIAGISLTSRMTSTIRQFAMGPNVPRAALEAAGLLVWAGSVLAGALMALRSPGRSRLLLWLAVVAFGVPLLLAATGIDDRFYARNMIAVVPLSAGIAASALLRLRRLPLLVYLPIAVATSLWVSTNWRYEQLDWRLALARIEAADPRAPVLAVTRSSAPVVATYLNRRPVSPVQALHARRAWIVIEPERRAGERALAPAAARSIPGFTVTSSTVEHGFRIELLTAPRPAPLTAAPAAGTILFPGD